MYAVFETGGKQYRVQPGDVVQVEKLDGDVGASLKFGQILLVSKQAASANEKSQIILGKPFVNGAEVEGEVVGQGRGEKVLIIKMKRRKQYRRTQGHRQFQTQLLVTSVTSGAGDKAALTAEEKKAKLASFTTQLTPKGPPRHPKILGSRVRMAAAAKAADKDAKVAKVAKAAKPAKSAK